MKAACGLTSVAFASLLAVAAAAPQTAHTQSSTGADSGPAKYTLRYRFQPGETLRWQVVHRAKTRTTVSGTTETAETLSKSVKVWRVGQVQPDGTATFQHLVESVDMWQQISGCPEVRYNSQTDHEPPPGFQDVAQSIGLVQSTVTISPQGEVVKRVRHKLKAGRENEGLMTIPLPQEPVPVGHTWSLPQDIQVKLNNGAIKTVKARQSFTLEEVNSGVATIAVATQILTPVDDPKLESQLIQREATGTVRFDIEAGRVLGQQMDVDKRVVGFSGAASSLHYATRFSEEILPAAARTAARPHAQPH